MLSFKGMRFPIDVILVCVRWYVAYRLSYRHLEEMMEEHGVSVGASWRMDETYMCDTRLLVEVVSASIEGTTSVTW